MELGDIVIGIFILFILIFNLRSQIGAIILKFKYFIIRLLYLVFQLISAFFDRIKSTQLLIGNHQPCLHSLVLIAQSAVRSLGFQLFYWAWSFNLRLFDIRSKTHRFWQFLLLKLIVNVISCHGCHLLHWIKTVQLALQVLLEHLRIINLTIFDCFTLFVRSWCFFVFSWSIFGWKTLPGRLGDIAVLSSKVNTIHQNILYIHNLFRMLYWKLSGLRHLLCFLWFFRDHIL